ncbi:tetratricopeptide repeat protein [Actinomadura violacea]|uniref:Tetratricopeptide repeat protein n=1 Tax=Actinomadura violacea TaxID=2819934 RepID=A0ABS3S4M7_9ACTN|nr:tetratricopeptide repeat protein [Actinomadura violacea]MBO2463949.1 tetratricopeptide repeat protein [Actinomadura violacea]
MSSAFQPRPDLRERIDEAGAEHTALVLSGGGGVGKSQLAAACAHQALTAGTDVVVWVDAAETGRIITGYATAALRVHAPDASGQDAESDAEAFLDWLAATSRSWLVVLDGVADVESADPWWPPPSRASVGRVLATTRRRDARLSGGGRALIEVDTFAPAESDAYLRARLTDVNMVHLLDAQAANLPGELGHLPLALAHAAAYMINEEAACADYLRLFTGRRSRLEALLPPEADTEGYGRPVAAALLVTLDVVQRRVPEGLAAPALWLVSHLDPAGHPLSLWADEAVTEYLTAHRTSTPEPVEVTAQEARAALRLLHQYSLISCDSREGARAVRSHALTARAARESAPSTASTAAAKAAADALVSIWPEQAHADFDLAAVVRANADTVTALAGDLLWHDDGHPLPYLAGSSLVGAGLYGPAIAHWQRVVTDAERLLGAEHPATLYARTPLVEAYRLAGRVQEAILAGERLAADLERLWGEDDSETVSVRATLATCYWLAGRIPEAISALERAATEMARLLGEDHPEAIAARHNLAACYAHSGRAQEAIALEEAVLADHERLRGRDDPGSLAARSVLAGAYVEAGRAEEGIALQELVVADRERILGEDHPTTVETRSNLAGHYLQAGRLTEAITLARRVVADFERLQGEGHPDVVTARSNLAALYSQAGHLEEAVPLQERAAADCERVLGAAHPDTLLAMRNLGHTYSKVGRHKEAAPLMERVVADSERVLGEEHPDSADAREILGLCYAETGRIEEAIPLLERAAADNERLLSAHHHLTITSWINVAAAYSKVGRTQEAIALLERLVADTVRTLGPHHPDTLESQAALAFCYRKERRLGAALTVLTQMAGASIRARWNRQPK